MASRFPPSDLASATGTNGINDISAQTCPDCGGVLLELSLHGMLQFRCDEGHHFSGEILLKRRSQQVCQAVSAAQRVFAQENALLTRLALQERMHDHIESAEALEGRASVTSATEQLLHHLLPKS
jgi:two-component system chemotaxis response regulator CheB